MSTSPDERLRSALEEFWTVACEYWQWGDGYGGYIFECLDQLAERDGRGSYTARPTSHITRERSRVTPAVRKRVMERDAFRCLVCGTHLDLVVDHIVALANGGTSDFDNLQTLCQPCNARKGARV
jgi:5-methylcytosine-specific restriction endonuclease McrA